MTLTAVAVNSKATAAVVFTTDGTETAAVARDSGAMRWSTRLQELVRMLVGR